MDISIGRFRGGFCVYWREDGRRKRYSLKALSLGEAEAEAIDVYRRETFKPGEAKVNEIWEAYRRELGRRPTAKTIGYTGKAVLPHFGHFRPDQITTEHCREYLKKRMRDGKTQGTVHTELGHLRSALRFAERNKIIDSAPHIERPPKPTPKERFLTLDEISSLINAANAPHIKLAILLLLGTAGRVGAILDLTWGRTDIERGVINLRKQDAITRKGRAIVPMNAGLKAALSTAKQAALSDFVVEYSGGQVKSIRKGFTNAVARAGLEDVTIHTLRHTAAVHLVSSGIPIEKVAQYLGHTNVAITYQTYARYAPGHLQDAAEILDFSGIRLQKTK